MAYIDTYYQAAQEEQIIRRLAVAVAKNTWYILAEDPQTANHDLRIALAKAAGPRLSDYRSFAQEYALYLLVQTGITPASTDEQMDSALAGTWDGYAAQMLSRGAITLPA